MSKQSGSFIIKASFRLERQTDGVFAIVVTLCWYWVMLISPIIVSVITMGLSFVSMHVSALFFLSIPLYYLSFRETDKNWTESEFGEE